MIIAHKGIDPGAYHPYMHVGNVLWAAQISNILMKNGRTY